MNEQNKIFEIADKITKHNFKKIWNIEGQVMSGLQKNEIAEEMFFKGIAYILDHLNSIQQINIDSVNKKLNKLL